MNLAKLPEFPAAMRHSLASAYVNMSASEFDQAVAAGDLPDPIYINGLERWQRSALDLALDKLAGNVGEVDWRTM